MEFQPTGLMISEKEIVGAVGYRPEDFDTVIKAVADGFYDTTGWVRERKLDDVVDAVRSLRAGVGSKILIRIG